MPDCYALLSLRCFFFQAEDGIRGHCVTGVQTCALPIYGRWVWVEPWGWTWVEDEPWGFCPFHYGRWAFIGPQIGRASCRERVESLVGGVSVIIKSKR